MIINTLKLYFILIILVQIFLFYQVDGDAEEEVQLSPCAQKEVWRLSSLIYYCNLWLNYTSLGSDEVGYELIVNIFNQPKNLVKVVKNALKGFY